MKTHIVIDGNAFYEIDEECMRQKMENEQKKIQKKRKIAVSFTEVLTHFYCMSFALVEKILTTGIDK